MYVNYVRCKMLQTLGQVKSTCKMQIHYEHYLPLQKKNADIWAALLFKKKIIKKNRGQIVNNRLEH